jgi:hypothetical protein
VQGRIERTVLDLQEIVSRSLDVFRNGVAVRGSEQERSKDEHIQGALQQLDAIG